MDGVAWAGRQEWPPGRGDEAAPCGGAVGGTAQGSADGGAGRDPVDRGDAWGRWRPGPADCGGRGAGEDTAAVDQGERSAGARSGEATLRVGAMRHRAEAGPLQVASP